MPAVQDSKPAAREPEPLPEEPRVVKPDTTVSQSSKDTVASGSQSEIPPRETGIQLSRSAVSPGQDIRQVQVALKNQGQYRGPIDGIMGPRTRQAVREFQKVNGLEQTGTLDQETMQKLAFER
jgi:peptidoglycan hydrolase-like protein with peptidoglycan-binding domain